MSHDTTNHPAHQRHAACTPACFALPSGTAPRKHTSHPGRANPHGTATSRTKFATRSAHTLEAILSPIPPIIPLTRRVYASMFRAPQWPARPRKSAWRCDITDVFRHTVSPHTSSNPITRYRQSSRSPATRRVYASVFCAPKWHGATQTHFPPRPRKSAWRCDITDVIRHTVCPHTRSCQSYHTIPPIVPLTNTSESSSKKLFPVLHLYYKLARCESSSKKLFPVLHLYYKLATSESSSEKLFPALHLYYKLATSESSSEKLFPLLHLCYKLATSDISPAFRAFDARDLRRGLRRTGPKRTLACISRPRHSRSPQKVIRAKSKTHSRLHFAPLTRTISAEDCPRQIQNALSPAFRALDTHDLCREGHVSWCSGGTAPGLKRESKEEREVKMRDVDVRM